MIEFLTIAFSGTSIIVAILLTKLNIINSRKSQLYSEQVLVSTVSIQSNEAFDTYYDIKTDKKTELVLKVYSINWWINWQYKITVLYTSEITDNWQRSFYWREDIVYKSDSHTDWDFSTKFSCLEYAQIKHQLKINITKTPFGTQKTFYFF